MAFSEIFKPLQVGKLTFRNRIEVAPAAPFLNWKTEDGTNQLKAYYRNLAASGAAIVHLGISSLEEDGRFPGMIRPACAPMRVEELPELVETLHAGGALAGVEVTVTRYMMGARERITTMPVEEVRGIIASYVHQAKVAADNGFDVLLVHGGHGNVPAQFYSAAINHRTDEYGGSEENRSRFALELLDAIRAEVGDRLAIEYRISAEEILPGSTTLEETLRFAQRIQDKIDLLHVSRGLLEEDATLPDINSPAYIPRGTNIPFARQFKKLLHIPVSVVCGMNLETAEKAIAAGDIDAAAMIRTALADPDFVVKAQQGREADIRPCVRCNTCINRTHTLRQPVRCAVNPMIGRETELEVHPAQQPKHVVVIGGGPAGMQAARTAAERGHRVTLLERRGHLGGSLCFASAAEFKGDMRNYLEWAIRHTVENPGITVRLNTEATPEMLRALHPEALVVAAGARPIIPRIATKPEKAIWVGDLETDLSRAGQNVVIAGAGFTGLEMALSLIQSGRKVTIIDMLPEERIGADGIAISMIWLKKALLDGGVRFRCKVRLEDATEEGAVISLEDGSREVIPCDTVVLSLGVRADKSAEEMASGLGIPVYPAGDCSQQGGTLFKATHGGMEAALKI